MVLNLPYRNRTKVKSICQRIRFYTEYHSVLLSVVQQKIWKISNTDNY